MALEENGRCRRGPERRLRNQRGGRNRDNDERSVRTSLGGRRMNEPGFREWAERAGPVADQAVERMAVKVLNIGAHPMRGRIVCYDDDAGVVAVGRVG